MNNILTKRVKSDSFPVIYERGKKRAVLVDIEIFEQLEMILDNLLNRKSEAEDKIIAEAEILKKIISKYQNSDILNINWRKELDEL